MADKLYKGDYAYGYVLVNEGHEVTYSFSEGARLFDLDYYQSMNTIDKKIEYYRNVVMLHATGDMKQKIKELLN